MIMSSTKPKLVVFDLDYTLWPFWVDTDVDSPFKLKGKGKVTDANGRSVKVYPEVPEILRRLHAEGYVMAVASRTTSVQNAHQLLELFQWNKFFTYKEIFPDSKITHFEKFRQKSGIPFESMLFFDDEYRNIVDVGSLGVTCVLVEDGVTEMVLKKGLDMFASKG